MVSLAAFRTIALSFPEATEAAHFEKISFRVKGKIFATCDEKNNRACLKLSETNQDLFSLADKSIVYPVNNKWGKQGWTMVELSKVSKRLFTAALTSAYCEVAPAQLAALVKQR
ncbi:MAG TPA: MmcQ/YjbR family DNA-binding protein [Bacteroidia bacterium]|nr:MmcQ/YjbR family DNA-binding protein [Bacteroidia bacterium]